MCLTYGRPAVLEEAIQSFLLQTYPGDMELIVLNDFPLQTLIADDPRVKMINVSQRFRTIGEKRNAAAALSTHDLLFVWDDDDIYLPHRIELSVERLSSNGRYFKPANALVLNDGKLQGPERNIFHSGGCWSRELFDRVNGYRHIGSGQDAEIENAFAAIVGNVGRPELPIQELFYLYRWSGTSSYHLSGFGKDPPGKSEGATKVAEYVARQMRRGEVPAGNVHLTPRWRVDYVKLVRDYIAAMCSAL
jgi:hypothetical protein